MDWGQSSIIWFIAGLILFILEMAVPGLVLLFFGMGAWLTAIVCLLTGLGINSQLILFIVSSVLFLVTLRKYVNKLFSGKKQKGTSSGENMEDYIGEKVLVVDTISPPRKGKVEFHGTHWSAESENEIPAGTTVEIVGKSNLTFKVRTL